MTKPHSGVAELFAACNGGTVEDVMRILLTGVDINSLDEWKMTPLMHSCAHGNIDMAR